MGFPSGQREQTVNLPSSTSKVRILPPTTISSITSKFELPPGGVPERPKGADCKSAVIDFEGSNPSPTTITFQKSVNSQTNPQLNILPKRGKDEKLRPRFDLSASERALPQATTRRAKRAALSNPSPPTTIASLNNQNLLLRANFARWHHVYRAYNILPCRSDKRSASDNSPRTVPIKKPPAEAGSM